MLHYRYRSTCSTCGLYRTRYMYVYVVVLLIINVCYVKSYPLILILFIPIRSYKRYRYPGTVHTKSKREKLRWILSMKFGMQLQSAIRTNELTNNISARTYQIDLSTKKHHESNGRVQMPARYTTRDVCSNVQRQPNNEHVATVGKNAHKENDSSDHFRNTGLNETMRIALGILR